MPLEETWAAPVARNKWPYRKRIRRMQGLSQATDFEIELSIIRKWNELQNSPEPKWRWFRECETELWAHRLACICAWSNNYEWNPWSERIMRATDLLYGGYSMLNIIGSQNSSKSQTMAHLVVQLLIEDPENVGIYIGSPYREATAIGIWGSVKAAFRDACKHLGWNASEHIKDSMGHIILHGGDEAGWIRVVSVDKVGMLQGKKPKNVHKGGLYLLIEESGAFDKNPGQALWDVLQNLFGQPRFKCLTDCNFKSVFGLDGRLCAPRRGSYSDLDVDKDQEWDSVRNGHTIRLDGHLSPNAGKKVKPYPYIVGDNNIAEMIASGFGPKSAKYMEQIRSFPVTGISQYTVTTMTKLQAGKVFETGLYNFQAANRWAFADPGLGGDAFKVAVCEIKRLSTGQSVIVPLAMILVPIDQDREWTPELIMQLDTYHRSGDANIRVGDKFTPEMQGAMATANILRSYGIPANQFGYDSSMRASVQRAMDICIGPSSRAMDYLGASPDIEMPSGIGNASKLYANYITFLWFLAADICENYALREGDIWLDAFEQMSGRLWEWSGQRKKMESKEDYKERNAQESPDDADAVVGVLNLIFERGGLFGNAMNNLDTSGVSEWLENRMKRIGNVNRRRLGTGDFGLGGEQSLTSMRRR